MKQGICFLIALATIGTAAASIAEPLDTVGKDEKCPVCGMFVAPHDQWLAQIIAAKQKPLIFDGVKDMMAYYFNSAAYGGSVDLSNAEIWVRNYYTLDYIDGRTAYYVIGSDVRGPMGDELIPFATKAEAENFKEDHSGSAVLRFEEIDAEQIMEMKKKHLMKMKKMKPEKQAG
jgi:copper chaperone NosL